ncbi:MAG: class II glutamine amidotransferase [Oscillospiraceae bacterium]|nr:class II glutamine amidotransferase [Oscillospiraceae bacterium]
MCALFGLVDYGNRFSAKQRTKIISVLSEECEVRGTDATRIAYNSNGRLHIFKRAVPAHKMRYKLPEYANIIMGHTRMTTQGSEKFNYNNHPFFGTAKGVNFALAHNGVLHNDRLLRKTENLPETHIQTDSYVAVQLIEKENSLCSESLKSMAEKTEGSFCYTVLSDRNELYIVKGDNPIALYKSDGFYIYASTEEILKNALQELNLSKFSKVNINCGDILNLDSNGAIEIGHFDFRDGFYGRYMLETAESYLEELAFVYGIETEDISTLLEFGYDVFEIEEMLCCPEITQEYLDYIRMR